MNGFNQFNINSHYSVDLSVLVKHNESIGETEEEAKKIANKILNLIKKLDVEKLTTEEIEDVNYIREVFVNYKTFEEAFKEWKEYKKNIKQISVSSMKAYEATFKYFFLFVDKQDKINSIDRDFFKEFQRILKLTPAEYFKKPEYFNKDIRTITKQYDFQAPQWETLHPKTINMHIAYLKNFYDYLVKEKYVEENYADIDMLNETKKDGKRIEYKKTSFTENDVYKLIKELKATDEKDEDAKNEHIDFIKVALFTGMRIGELSLLEKEDIDIDLQTINIKEGKTESAARTILIHPYIEDIIFARMKKSKNNVLFFEGNTDANGKRLNRRINKIIPDKYKTFHQLRYSFVQSLYAQKEKHLIDETTIKYLTGHSQNKNLTFSLYNESRLPLNLLRVIINRIKIDEVIERVSIFDKTKVDISL